MSLRTLRSRLTSLAAFCALVLSSAALVRAQEEETSQYDRGTPPQHAAGVSAAGSYVSADLGTVNLSNGSLNFNIPLGSVGGRGFSLPLTLNYTSKVWSAQTGLDTVNDPRYRRDPAVFAVYDDPENPRDIYQKVAPGWTLGAVPVLHVKGVGISPGHNNSNGCNEFGRVLTKLTVIMPDKGEVELRDDYTDGSPLGALVGPQTTPCRQMDAWRGQRWHATDGSGIIFISDQPNAVVEGDLNGWLITSDGTRYRFGDIASGTYGGSAYRNEFARATSITDRHGNLLTIAYSAMTSAPYTYTVTFTDQLGRTTLVKLNAPDPSDPTQTLAALVDLPGYGGARRYYKLKTGVMNQNYRAGTNPTLPVINGDAPCREADCEWPGDEWILFGGSWGGGAERVDDRTVLTRLVLPDGRHMRFRYNEFGEVSEVETPAGGKVQYDYAADIMDGLPAGNSPDFEVNPLIGNVRDVDRAVVARRTYPDGANVEAHWAYDYSATRGLFGAASNGVTEVVARAADNSTVLLRAKHYFLNAARFLDNYGGTGYALWSTGLERRTERLNSAGATVLAASEEDWSQRAPVVWTSGLPDEQIQNDNRVGESRNILDDGQVARTTYSYDAVNNPTEVAEYDFAGALKRRTVKSYSATNFVNGDNYAGDSIRLLRLPLQESVYDGAGVEQARTVFEYDVYADDGNHAGLVARSPVTGHDSANYGAGRTERGNPTRVARWLKSGDTYVHTYPRYDVLGNVVSVKNPRGNVSTTDYSDNFGDGSNPLPPAPGSAPQTFALPTVFTSPPPAAGQAAHKAYAQYDFSTGLQTGFRDRNGVVAQTFYDDAFNRPTLVKSALGVAGVESHARTFYAPATAHGVTLSRGDSMTVSDLNTPGDASLRAWAVTDGFGRAVEGWAEDPVGDVKVVTEYDGLGRAKRVSNPSRPSLGQTPVYTTTSFDLLGRVTAVTTPDGAAATTTYSGDRVLYTDQEGKQRVSRADALGRLTDVWEVRSADAATVQVTFPGHAEVTHGYRTAYTYDALDNLRKVDQGGQHRFFMYDSLGRLTRARNPEQAANAGLAASDPVTGNSQWSLGYAYDAAGNLTSRTDARGVVTSYTYDALNRGTAVDYSDTARNPDVERSYDGATNGKGRFWHDFAYSQDGAKIERTNVESYDAAGRPLSRRQLFYEGGAWSAAYTSQYTYDLAGNVKTHTYPSGRTVNYTYDASGRLQTFTGRLGDGSLRTYSDQIRYEESGRMEQERFGTSTPVYNKSFYNVRGQLSEIRVSTHAITEPGQLRTDYDRGAIINHYSNAAGAWGATGGGPDNNGNLKRQDVYIPNPGGAESLTTQIYDYDALNRLDAAREVRGGVTQWQQDYVYDRWGNRTVSASGTWGNVPEQQCAVDTTTNRLGVPAGWGGRMDYDAAGNLTNDSYTGYGGATSAATRTYDADNRMTSAQDSSGQTSRYTYDADGRRVRRKVGSGAEAWQVYGIGGELLAEYEAGASYLSPKKEYGYRAGALLVTAEVAGAPPEINLAAGKTATQSSTYAHATNPTASKAVDGNTDGNFASASMSHTNSEAQAWWQVNLGGVQQINTIKVWNRADCCADRLTDFYVIVSDVPFTSTNLQTTLAQPGVSAYRTEGQGGRPTSVAVNRTGRYVRVQLAGTNYLGLAEVEVMGVAVAEPVQWTGAVGVTASGNNLTKSSTGALAWDAGASSTRAIASGDGYVEFTATEATASRMVGLSNGDSNQGYADIDFAIYPSSTGALYVYEGGQSKGQFGTYAAGDRLRVAVEGGQVRYRKNGALLYTSVASPQYPLSADTSFFHPSATVTDATIAATATTDIRWLVSDQLGTPRMVFDQTGSLAGVSRHDYLPFGEEIGAGMGGRTTAQGYGQLDDVRQKFTSKERDQETGLDYSLARYYSSTQGRFTGVDPLMASAYVGNPQSWNRYTYALNNPLRVVDPNGMKPVFVFREYNKLTEDERRILNNSTVTFGEGKKAVTFTKGQGEALYNYMKSNPKEQKQLAGFLNLTAGLADIKFANGRSAISYVQGITGVRKGERIYANVDADLRTQIETISTKKATKGVRFIGPSGQAMDHTGPDGTNYDESFRENIVDGQMQLSFSSKNRGKLDMDADEKGKDCIGCDDWDHARAAWGGADPVNIYRYFVSRPTGTHIQPSYTIEEKKK